MNWMDYSRNICDVLSNMVVTDGSGKVLETDAAFQTLRQWTVQLFNEKRIVYCVGNGASASIASHFATDMAKNGKLHTEVFFDLSLVTAVGNDLGYENVFLEPLSRRAVPGDMLVAISSSGNSPNVLKAVQYARQAGVKVIGFSAMSENNSLRLSGDLNFYLPARTYGDAESVHATVLHHWINCYLGQYD